MGRGTLAELFFGYHVIIGQNSMWAPQFGICPPPCVVNPGSTTVTILLICYFFSVRSQVTHFFYHRKNNFWFWGGGGGINGSRTHEIVCLFFFSHYGESTKHKLLNPYCIITYFVHVIFTYHFVTISPISLLSKIISSKLLPYKNNHFHQHK